MLVLQLMVNEFKHIPESKLEDAMTKYVLSYDNMCHLNSLKAAKADLPLPSPYNVMWKKIHKVIDRLHLPNHKDQSCQQNYNPDNILPDGYNTIASEQLLAWMGRFKKIVNSMTQTHHLFYLHRMCKRRNAYTARCRRIGREPVIPGINLNIKT